MTQLISRTNKAAVLACLAAGLLARAGQAGDTKTVPPATPGTIPAPAAPPAAPPVSITLYERHGHATPVRSGCVHTGGGNVDVQQPSPDTFVITMTGVAVAYPHPHGSVASMTFDV